MCGGGSANIITDQNINLYDAFTARFGREKVRDREVHTQTDAVIITIGANGQEGFDRKSLNMDIYCSAICFLLLAAKCFTFAAIPCS